MNLNLPSLMFGSGDAGTAGMIGGAIVGAAIVAAGIFVMFTPAKHFLSWDRRTGYWFYCQELKASGDEKRAVAAAAVFYKVFGGFMIVFGTVWVFAMLLF